MDEHKYRESFEKFPPDWSDYEYDPDDIDDEQENKCLNPSYLKNSFRKR